MQRLLALFLFVVPAYLEAQPTPRVGDAQIMRDARQVTSAGRVDLYEHRGAAPKELAALADKAITQLETLLGSKLDSLTLGERVSIYVSADTRVSHVLGGYEHQRNPKAVLFLSPMVAQLALSGKNATYAHELAHLLTWRFHSHTLREGLADYLALQLHPGAGVGPNRDGYGAFPPVVQGVAEVLGTTSAPPSRLISDQAFRESYYASSYRFVRHLIVQGGLPKFLELYAAREPELVIKELYGQDNAALVEAALR